MVRLSAVALFLFYAKIQTMKSTNITELSANDSTQLMVRKINANFANLYSSVSTDVSTTYQLSASGVSDLTSRVNSLEAELKELIDTSIKTLKEEMTPDVGTYMYSSKNPGDKWPDTTWQRVTEGNFLIAAGTNYIEGRSYGANEVTLTVDQMPAHTHQDNISLLQWNTTKGNLRPASTSTTQGEGTFGSSNYRDTSLTSSTGGGNAHNNIPLSIAVPLWKRTK